MKHAPFESRPDLAPGNALDYERPAEPAPVPAAPAKELFGCRLAFSVKEVAAILGVSEKTVRRLISRGLLRASRALRHHLIPKKEIEKFLDRTMGD